MDYNSLIELQGTLFLLVFSGIVLKKMGVLTAECKPFLTDLVLDFILPCNIINSFRMKWTSDTLKGFVVIIIVALAIQAGCLILSKILYNRQPIGRKKVLQYATVVSNAGFLGNPIAEGVFGSVGLVLASVYLIPQRVVMWSAGLSIFTESPNRRTLIKKVLTHPCIIAVFIGFIIMIFQIPLPGFLGNTIKTVGSCTTAISMILIGLIVAEMKPEQMLDITVFIYSGIRLVLIPLLTLIGCRLFHVDELITGVSVLLAGMPAGSTTAILATKFNGDSEFATKCVVVSTILSLISIPMWCLVF